MSAVATFIQDVRRRRVLSNAALYIVAAWVVVQVADVAIDAGVIRWPLRDVFVAAFLGFPVALILSWFYDVTRRGIVRTPPASADDSFDESLHKRDYLLIASLVAVWAAATVLVHAPAPIDKSIAILPFENRGHDPQGADLAFGVRLDLHTQLEKLQDIKIIARTSAETVDQELPIPDLARKLGVAFIMKGTVERILDRVRVSVSLIDAESEQSWSFVYDRSLDVASLFDIRDDITGEITGNLQAELSPQEQQRIQIRPTEDFDAYRAYLLGKQRMARRTTGPLAEAVDYFEQAVELDPEFALAYVGLADSYYLHDLYTGAQDSEVLLRMESAIATALELDDSLGEAYVSLGNMQSIKGDEVAAETAFKRGLELNPNYATAHQWYGAFLISIERTEEGLAHRRKALELDPLSSVINFVLGDTLRNMGRYDEAIAQYERVIEIDPAYANAYERMGDIYVDAFGRLDEAVIWQMKGIALDPGEPMGSFFLGLLYLDLGDPVQAERWFERSGELTPPGSPMSGMYMEPLYVYRGQEAESLAVARNTLNFCPGCEQTLAHLRNHDLRVGNYAEARARYERAFPAYFTEDDQNAEDLLEGPTIDIASVLIKTGEQKMANLLLDSALEALQEDQVYDASKARIHALRGETEEALAALREAVDQGWRRYWWFYLEHDITLESIRGEPGFQSVLQEIKADMAAQLERVRMMAANGELEPVPDID